MTDGIVTVVMSFLTNIRCIISDHVLIVVHSCEWYGPVQGRNDKHFLEVEKERDGGRGRGDEWKKGEERERERTKEREYHSTSLMLISLTVSMIP